jgi:hypothetical protein
MHAVSWISEDMLALQGLLCGVNITVLGLMFAAAMLDEISVSVFMFSCVTVLGFMVSR